MNIWTIVSIGLGVLSTLLGGHLVALKSAVKEFKDIPVSIEKALQDDKITVDELKGILKEIREFIKAVKTLF